jgi:hypothetical protein
MLILLKLSKLYYKIKYYYANKKCHKKVEQEVYRFKVEPSSKAVIELNNRLKIVKNTIPGSTCATSKDDLYITFLDFIKRHSQGQRIPLASTIEDALGIDKRKRLEFLNQAADDGILIKPSKQGVAYKCCL